MTVVPFPNLHTSFSIFTPSPLKPISLSYKSHILFYFASSTPALLNSVQSGMCYGEHN